MGSNPAPWDQQAHSTDASFASDSSLHPPVSSLASLQGLRGKTLLRQVTAALGSLRHRHQAVHEAAEAFKRGEMFNQMHRSCLLARHRWCDLACRVGLRAPHHELHSSPVQPSSVVALKQDCSNQIAQGV